MSSAGVLCLCALALLIVFAICSAVWFPRCRVSQRLFETFGVLCIALVLMLGILRSIPPEALFPKRDNTPPAENPIAASFMGTTAGAAGD